jgi:hypothetical protein
LAKTYLWCDSCKRSFEHDDARNGHCPLCAEQMRELGWMSAFVRGMMAQEFVSSGLASRHRTMIKMIWTANGMGERYFNALDPGVSYSKFETEVTDFVCQAAADGWVKVVLPPSPIGAADESYKLEIEDEERFVLEISALFLSESKPEMPDNE